MIVSWNWLTEYVRLDLPVDDLTDRLALAGLNHESTEDVGGDLAIDLEITSNRPDCLSHLGVAREIGVLLGRAAREPDPRPRAKGKAVADVTGVTIEADDLCPRFTARVVRGVKVGESPWWLRKRLETLGVRPISNIVDITNYVMFECGQPLHAYDLARLDGRRLVVRRARAGETLKAINGKTYELTAEMLTIADAARPVGLAGVMGGLDTEIGPETKDVLIESAQFDPMSVRGTSRSLGLMSPSSFRFERPMDPGRTEWASRRCAQMILDIAGGSLCEGLVDVGSSVREPAPTREPVTLRFAQIPRVLGIEIPAGEVHTILGALGLHCVSSRETEASFVAPSWRSDLDREIDLIEEVARIHGYGHIPEDRPVPLCRSRRGDRERVEALIREALCAQGFDEACTFSLVPEELDLAFEPDASAPLRVNHSSRKRETILRRSIVPSLLAARAGNQARGTPDADLFEIAGVYLPKPAAGTLPDEPSRLSMVSGRDFSGLKAVVEAVLDRLHIPVLDLSAAPFDHPLFTPGRAAALGLGGKPLGWLGEVAAPRRDAFELRGAASAAELDLAALIAGATLIPRYAGLPSHPGVMRDLSLVIASDLPWSDLAATVRPAAGPCLESLDFLDTFQGGDLPPDRQSLHFGLRFRHPERTLTGDEVDQAVAAVVEACAKRFQATLRA
jgi:phenylalanyl-tRNA synthetase beta chain